MEVLLVKIDQFLEDKQKDHFHAVPMQYKSITFLLWRDSEIALNRNLIEIKERIDRLDKGKEKPLFVYCEIDKKTFEKEARTTQGFIFYPEMTEKVREMIETKEDTGE